MALLQEFWTKYDKQNFSFRIKAVEELHKLFIGKDFMNVVCDSV